MWTCPTAFAARRLVDLSCRALSFNVGWISENVVRRIETILLAVLNFQVYLTVASLGTLVSPGAATDGVALFPEKLTTFLVIALCKAVTFFSCHLVTSTSFVQCSF